MANHSPHRIGVWHVGEHFVCQRFGVVVCGGVVLSLVVDIRVLHTVCVRATVWGRWIVAAWRVDSHHMYRAVAL